jgi:sugar lactone lactonase YvrE
MTGTKFTGTVAITVGSATATLPITGSIDKNGYFVLTAKGTGANKGFGCVLLYDVATGTYRPNKNTVTAPNQKAIKF